MKNVLTGGEIFSGIMKNILTGGQIILRKDEKYSHRWRNILRKDLTSGKYSQEI